MSNPTKATLPTRIVVYSSLTLWAAVTILPLYWLFSTTFKSSTEALSFPPTLFPHSFSLTNIEGLFSNPEGGLSFGLRPYLNSLLISLATALGASVISFLAGFGFSRFRFRGREVLLLSLLFLNLVPDIAKMIPLFYLYTLYGIYDTYIGLILLHTIGAAPFAAWLMRGYIDTIPKDLEDSAVIDGCSRRQVTWRIIAPLAAPGMAAVAVLAFRRAWGDFAGAVMLTTSRDIQPYTTVLYSFVSEHKIDWSRLSAAAFVSTIPIVIVFAFFQKYFVSGLTAGAVKN